MRLDRLKNLELGDYRPDLSGAKALAAEGIGSFVLVLAAAGASSAFKDVGGRMDGLQMAFAPGLALGVLVLLFAPVSLALFNPALTLGMALAGRLPKSRVLPYAGAQCAGALVAGLVLRLLLQSSTLGITTTRMAPLGALLMEALLTAWLLWVYLAMTEKDAPLLQAALALGATLSGALLWAGPFSGASMNPARSLGPALAAFDLSDLWIYLTGPFLGAWGGARAYAWFRALR